MNVVRGEGPDRSGANPEQSTLQVKIEVTMNKAFYDGFFQAGAFTGLLGVLVIVFTNNIIQYWSVLLTSLVFIGFYVLWNITGKKYHDGTRN